MTQDQLSSYLDEFLNCALYADSAPNGMQVEGKKEIKRLCTAVTASEEAITKAIDWQADALLVHHGYFWRGEDPVITGMKGRRVGLLLKHEMNLLAYHLPLDCHVELGNNACLSKLFMVHSVEMHQAGNTKNLLWSGTLAQPMAADEYAAFLEKVFARKPLHISGTNKKISRIAWCSGAAQGFIAEASKLGVDAYISGEVSERTYYEAKELGIHYYACGHHATERYGIQSLGEHIAAYFDLEHLFIDSDNPV